MERLSLFLLGSFGVTVDGAPVTTFESDKVRALLAYLAVESERPHRRESLAGLLWPDFAERSARQNLSQALFDLRRAIGDRHATPPFLIITRQTIQFNRSSDHWLDVSAFTGLLTGCEQHPHDRLGACEACMERLKQAVDLHEGQFLAGFSLPDSPAFEEWVLLERERLQRLVTDALGQLADCQVERGAYDDALKHARRLLELDPLLEAAHRQVMLALAYSGGRSAALAQYESCRQILHEELGFEPEPETTALYERVLAGELAAPAQVTAPPHNLPPQPTPFVGQEALLAAIAGRLEDPACRLLTLVGPGGSGKTRLALEAAAAQLERYPHGVFFVSLAPLDAVEAIVPTVADAVGFSFYAEERGGVPVHPQQQLLDYLRGKSLLLVLDNYEHLLAGAGLVTEILRTAPNVKVLATSRARLNVGGEHRFPITGMDYPDPETPTGQWGPIGQYSAIQLFLQGARRAQPDFELTDDNLSGVLRICSRVEGMPLAIRLAAAWVDALTPAEIATEIARSLDFLETERRDVSARQHSMRATFDHSWRLLTGREREVLQGVSVFRGGFTREAAQAVTGASLRELRALVNKSLLQFVPRSEAQTGQFVPHSKAQTGQFVPRSDAQTGQFVPRSDAQTGQFVPRSDAQTGRFTPSGRYEIHELLRQYAEEKLDASPAAAKAAHDRHCAYYAAALERWGMELKGARQGAALAEMRADQENARAAWERAVAHGQVARLDQAVEGLCRFYERRGRFQEGEAACRVAVEALSATEELASTGERDARAGDRVRVWGKLLAWQGSFCHFLGRLEVAGQLLRRGLDLLEAPALADADTRADRAHALHKLSAVARDSGDPDKERRLAEQSLALYRAVGDRWGTAILLGAAANRAWDSGAYTEARRWAEESLVLRRGLGDQWGVANALNILGRIARAQGELEESERLLREAIAIHEEIGHRGIESASGLLQLTMTLTWRGKFGEAHTVAQEGLARCEDTGLRTMSVWLRIVLGGAKLHLGHYEEARAQLQISLDLSRELGLREGVGWSLLFLGRVALALEAYPEAQGYLQESAAISQEVERRYLHRDGLPPLGYAARGLGELPQAWKYLCQALQLANDIRDFPTLVQALPAVALLLADHGESERAVELYALTSRYPYVANSRWFEDVTGKQIAAVAATLPPEVVAAAQERGRARDLWETAEELLEELEAQPSRYTPSRICKR